MTQLPQKPERPFFAMNNRYIIRFSKYKNFGVRAKEIFADIFSDPRPNGQLRIPSSPNMPDLISEDALKNGWATSNATIIDINCRKFKVTGLVTNGIERDIFNLFGLVGKRRNYFEFVTGEPKQLTFEEARDEVIEHICSHRWAGQTGGTPAGFRKFHGTKTNMAGLIDGISFYGKWPF